ncbi:MAG TPA: hypothetical protein VK501_22355 [Baekduia sp.]|uniref:hypothetical protein n=1 Tax=Baekduia sp. TaxID=2600305 RepID=UPI002C14CC66|nr:hypothetical protein [Baekduia sp.]HMJ36664.1 hypothetical protein [Baekduia sp.]
MPSVVNRSFRNAVAEQLGGDLEHSLRHSAGGNPAFREMHRALALASRAAAT